MASLCSSLRHALSYWPWLRSCLPSSNSASAAAFCWASASSDDPGWRLGAAASSAGCVSGGVVSCASADGAKLTPNETELSASATDASQDEWTPTQRCDRLIGRFLQRSPSRAIVGPSLFSA